MAYLKYGRLLATARNTTLYSRWHSPDRRLYNEEERARIGVNRHHQWWVYHPELVALPVEPLTPEAREGLERTLPF